ncbi:hypothetical protein MMC31_001897, partial [Peltigera leucophlebia]|nr:hypothetical protein [Peltigera leucophlebia]
MGDCDGGLIKKRRDKTARKKKAFVRKNFVEQDESTWGPKQESSFQAIKDAITSNAMAGFDPTLQYHL